MVMKKVTVALATIEKGAAAASVWLQMLVFRHLLVRAVAACGLLVWKMQESLTRCGTAWENVSFAH